MLKGRSIMHLDGSFDYPVEKFSRRAGAKWIVVSRGPKYVNEYEIIEFDSHGERWLVEHDIEAVVGKEEG